MPYYFAPAIGSGLMEMLDGAIKFLYEQIISIPGESSESHAALAMKQVITAMTFSDVDTKTISAVLSVITPVAFLLMVINFMAGLAKSGFDGRPGAQDDMLDMTIRCGIWLIIADFTLSHLADIVGHIMSLSVSFGNTMMGSLEGLSEVTTMPLPDTARLSLLALIFMLFGSFVAWFLNLIIQVIIVVVCLSAKIEVMLRIAFLPFGIASLANAEQSHEGMRYIKKLLASAFYCAGIVIAMYIANTASLGSAFALTEGDQGGVFGYVFSLLLITFARAVAPLASIGVVSIAKSMINEAFRT